MSSMKKYIGLIGVGVAAAGYVGWRIIRKSVKTVAGRKEKPAVESVSAEKKTAEKPSAPVKKPVPKAPAAQKTTAPKTPKVPAKEPAPGKSASEAEKKTVKPPSGAAEKPRRPRPATDAKKTTILGSIADVLKEQNADAFTIRFGQSRQRGYRGYYLSGITDASVFVGWSKEYESAYEMTPFWIELDPVATARFKESGGLDHGLDIYPHPAATDRILIAIPADIAGKPAEAAAKVLDIARATLV